jgi:hypothetical protein
MDHFLGTHIESRSLDYDYCLLNSELEVRVLEKGHFDEILAYASGEDTAVVAIDAPARVNAGLMQHEHYRQKFKPPPTPNRWINLRFGEYELVRQRMKVSRTPANKGACPQWMQLGIDLHEAVSELGYTPYPLQSEKIVLEVPAEASFQSLLGKPLLPSQSTEGRIQRQLLLWRLGVQIGDPMEAFEEVTRYRLERGKFPFGNICSPAQLCAMMAAFTAWLVRKRPDQIQNYGEEEEGLLVLPVQLILN